MSSLNVHSDSKNSPERLLNVYWLKGLSIFVVLVVLVLINISPAFAMENPSGTELFQTHCAGCHINGGNIVRRNKTLKLNSLQRNQMDSLEAIAQIVTNGKNNMPAFKDRLTEQQIQDVAAYVWQQAQQGWQS